MRKLLKMAVFALSCSFYTMAFASTNTVIGIAVDGNSLPNTLVYYLINNKEYGSIGNGVATSIIFGDRYKILSVTVNQNNITDKCNINPPTSQSFIYFKTSKVGGNIICDVNYVNYVNYLTPISAKSNSK